MPSNDGRSSIGAEQSNDAWQRSRPYRSFKGPVEAVFALRVMKEQNR